MSLKFSFSMFPHSRHERPAARCDWPDHGHTFRWRGIEDDAAIAFLIEGQSAFGIEAGANRPVHVLSIHRTRYELSSLVARRWTTNPVQLRRGAHTR